MGKFEIADLGEQFLARVSCVPTLKAALESFRDLAAVEDTNARFGISYGETAVKLRMSARILLNAQDQYFDDWGDLLVMVAIVRAFAERAWQPPEMEFRSTVIPGRYAAEQFPNTHFITGQKVYLDYRAVRAVELAASRHIRCQSITRQPARRAPNRC